jgi:hypothetical protein
MREGPSLVLGSSWHSSHATPRARLRIHLEDDRRACSSMTASFASSPNYLILIDHAFCREIERMVPMLRCVLPSTGRLLTTVIT